MLSFSPLLERGVKEIAVGLVYILCAAYIFLIAVSGSRALFFGLLVALFVVLAVKFNFGLSLWIMAAPLVAADFLLMASLLSCMFLTQLALRKQILREPYYLLPLIGMVALSIWSSLTSGYLEYIHVLYLYAVVFLVSYIIMLVARDSKSNLLLISGSFIGAGLIATFVALNNPDDVTRMSLAENVRQLANVCGMGLVLLVVMFFPSDTSSTSHTNNRNEHIIHRFRWLIAAVLIYGLISTMSRGVIIAVVAAIVVAIGGYVYRLLRALHIWRMYGVLGVLVVGVYSSFAYRLSLFEYAGLDYYRFSHRFTDSAINSGSGVRREIWRAAIVEMSPWNIAFGNGVSSFRMLARRNGYDFYAHSVFVDTFVVAGVAGAVVLLWLLSMILYKALKSKDVAGLALIVFVVLAHASHGTITSRSFWYLVPIAYASVRLKERDCYFNGRLRWMVPRSPNRAWSGLGISK